MYAIWRLGERHWTSNRKICHVAQRAGVLPFWPKSPRGRWGHRKVVGRSILQIFILCELLKVKAWGFVAVTFYSKRVQFFSQRFLWKAIAPVFASSAIFFGLLHRCSFRWLLFFFFVAVTSSELVLSLCFQHKSFHVGRKRRSGPSVARPRTGWASSG